jgi:hypothetical protein
VPFIIFDFHAFSFMPRSAAAHIAAAPLLRCRVTLMLRAAHAAVLSRQQQALAPRVRAADATAMPRKIAPPCLRLIADRFRCFSISAMPPAASSHLPLLMISPASRG